MLLSKGKVRSRTVIGIQMTVKEEMSADKKFRTPPTGGYKSLDFLYVHQFSVKHGKQNIDILKLYIKWEENQI